MVDLSYERGRGSGTGDRDEEPIGLIILGCMPFVILLIAMLAA